MTITSSQTGAFTSAPFLLRRRSRFVQSASKTLGVTEDAAKTLLKIVGEDANIPEDKLAEALATTRDSRRLPFKRAGKGG